MRTGSPACRPRRSSTSGSAPPTPSAPSACGSGIAGSRTGADQRVGRVHRLQLDQLALAGRRPPAACAWSRCRRRGRRAPAASCRSASGSGCAPPSISRSPPSSARPLLASPASTAGAQAADRGDRGHAERQAGEHDAHAAHAAAQVAAREPERQPHRRTRSDLAVGDADLRPQRAASAGSWVISSRVVPLLALHGEQQVHHGARRWRGRGCRSARRPAAGAGGARRRGPGRRAAARRRTAGPAGG